MTKACLISFYRMLRVSGFLILCSSSFSCTQESRKYTLNGHLENLRVINPSIDQNNKWEVDRVFDSDRQVIFQLSRNYEPLPDKEKLIFHFYKDSSNYLIESYHKEYLLDTVLYVIEMNKDTVYFYHSDLERKGERYFILGKYAFQFSNKELSPGQRRYYMLKYDSLDRVRGNDLPPLPEITRDQLKWEFPRQSEQVV